jgi:hypothetical protein
VTGNLEASLPVTVSEMRFASEEGRGGSVGSEDDVRGNRLRPVVAGIRISKDRH